MRFLVTNDDGVHARGLAVLASVAAQLGQVTVVAPDREQSATSHSLTLHRPVRATRLPDGRYTVDGTPTDCVMLALGALMPDKPTFLLSGVNHGPNMGEDVLYSGTVSAAMEGLTAGVPSVAVSFAGADLDMLESQERVLGRLLGQIVAVPDFPKETLLSVNLPPRPASEVKGIKVTTLGTRAFSEEIMQMRDPWGRPIYWIGGGRVSWSGSDDSDFRAVHDGYVSVTPLHVDLTNYRLLEAVRAWRLSV